MKFALLSDIHGNVEALKAVVNAAQDESVSGFLIAGDIIGYYFRTNEVLNLISSINAKVIRGNHEDLFEEWLQDKEKRIDLQKKYGNSFLYNQDRLSKEQKKYLKELPVKIEEIINGKTVLVCHGSPWDSNEYVYPDCAPEKTSRFFAQNKDLVVFGHTHYPVLWEKKRQIVVNPGSVGQPRDRKGGACWALWDSESHTVSLHRTFYDVEPVLQDCRDFSPETSYLINILTMQKGGA